MLFVVFRCSTRIRNNFWSIQPVFHIYDIHHWFNPNKVIDPRLPYVNKYVDVASVKTMTTACFSESQIGKICEFVRNEYGPDEYKPEIKHIWEYFKNSSHPSYLSIYENDLNEINSIITARILHITLNMKTRSVYYIDNLCVHSLKRKKSIASKMIQTLHYTIRRKNLNVNIFLFKREGDLTAIVPLTTFECKGFDISVFPECTLQHASMKLIELTGHNIQLGIDFMYRKKGTKECIIVPDITNIINLINQNILSFYGIIENDTLISLYIFRDSATFYNNEKAVEVVSSLSSCHHKHVFKTGFQLALREVSIKYNATKVVIDEIGDNNQLTGGHSEFFSNSAAFFLYNYACYTIAPSECFIIY